MPALDEVTDATFEDVVLRSPLPVVVDFWATWCPPCRPLAGTLAALAAEFDGRLRIVTINADENPGRTRDHRVLSMPTLLVFRGGTVVASIVGLRPAGHLRATFEQLLAPYANR